LGTRRFSRRERYAHPVDPSPPTSLYLELAEYAREQQAPGQTNTTKAKETVDNDVEALMLDVLAAS
jgi:hypothetical protein